jgi:hypothetical protein
MEVAEGTKRLKARGEHKLNDRGQCCGKKPLVYKRQGMRFCIRCDAAYDLTTGEQIPNWAWQQIDGGFVRHFELHPAWTEKTK